MAGSFGTVTLPCQLFPENSKGLVWRYSPALKRRYRITGSPRVAMVKPFSVRAYCTLGGRVFMTCLSIMPSSSSILNLFERIRGLIPLIDFRSPVKPIVLRVYRTVIISMDHLLKMVLMIIRVGSVASDKPSGV